MDLLKLLFGHNDPSQPQNPAQVPSQVQQPQGPGLQGPAPQAPGDDITIQGDAWKPHNASILGQIADYFLGTHFGKHNDDVNMEEASQGMMSRPEDAIRRIAKFDAPAAWKLRSQNIDDKRMQATLDRQNSVLDLQKDRYVDGMVGNMMYSALQSGDPANWTAMKKQALIYGNRYGKDYSSIPDTPDPSYGTSLAMGVIPAAKQMQAKETAQHHRKTEDIGQQNANSREAYTNAAIQQGSARIGIGQQNADTAGRNADTAENREAFTEKTKGQGQGVQTKYGPAMISDDGKSMTLYPHSGTAPDGYDGKGIHYIRVNGKWVPANTRTK